MHICGPDRPRERVISKRHTHKHSIKWIPVNYCGSNSHTGEEEEDLGREEGEAMKAAIDGILRHVVCVDRQFFAWKRTCQFPLRPVFRPYSSHARAAAKQRAAPRPSASGGARAELTPCLLWAPLSLLPIKFSASFLVIKQ